MNTREPGRLIPFRLPPPKKILPLRTAEVEVVYELRAILVLLDGFAHCLDRVDQLAHQTASFLSELVDLLHAHGEDSAEARQLIAQAEREGAVAREGAEGLRATRRTLTAQVGGEEAWPVTVYPDDQG